MAEERYYRGQGRVYIFDRSPTGKPINGYFVGNVPELMTRFESGKVEHTESKTGKQLKDLVLSSTKSGMLTCTLEKFDSRNLAMALYGTALTVAGATVTAEPHSVSPDGFIKLNRMNLTAFTSLTPTGPTPTPYVAGTDYKVNLKSGMVEILAGGAIAADTDVLANYTFGSIESTGAFNAPTKNKFLVFEGLNTAEEDAPVIIQAFKVFFQPTSELQLINNEDQVSQLQLEGELLYDDLQTGINKYLQVDMSVAA
jgi:hypothetical protein